ncbi:hypothetical protein BH18ACT7_BH18ACT7_07860 [soil metagenome]
MSYFKARAGTSCRPASSSARTAPRSAGVTCVEPTNASGSQTSASVGATLKSPASTNGRSAAASGSMAERRAVSQRSLYAKCGSSGDRPLGTYTDMTRTPPQVAAIARASGGCSASGNDGMPGKPTAMLLKPIRDRTATPFQRPSPWTAAAYPSSATSARGNAASGHLVSCRQTTSGPVSRNQASSRGNRALTELTFHVTSRTGG